MAIYEVLLNLTHGIHCTLRHHCSGQLYEYPLLINAWGVSKPVAAAALEREDKKLFLYIRERARESKYSWLWLWCIVRYFYSYIVGVYTIHVYIFLMGYIRAGSC